MTTRTEIINGYTYCAYCGKELKNPHYGICPEPPTICTCETAKEELDLYKKQKGRVCLEVTDYAIMTSN